MQEEDEEVVQLSTIVMSAVDGVYMATIKLGDNDPDADLVGGRGQHLIGGHARGCDPPARLFLKLEREGAAKFMYLRGTWKSYFDFLGAISFRRNSKN